MGSVFTEAFGFRTSQDIMSVVVLIAMIFYFIFCGRMKMFTNVNLGDYYLSETGISRRSSSKVLKKINSIENDNDHKSS
jgi:hypothetical protein